MPFKKVGKDEYQGPSGKKFNKRQVALYHANGGKFPSKVQKRKKTMKQYERSSADKRADASGAHGAEGSKQDIAADKKALGRINRNRSRRESYALKRTGFKK